MAGISLSQNDTPSQADGLRPVNLRTDLAQLADLIETAFSSTMDSGGRSAVREMRQLSRLGMGLGLLTSLNDLAQGMSLGYVWVHQGRVVGNVSVYPADYPPGMGKRWIIANVAVYPAYRGQGVATRLMQASLDMIRQRGPGSSAILQVDADNTVAQKMYRKLGFYDQRTFHHWRRGRYLPLHAYAKETMPPDYGFRVVSRRLGDSRRELALAQEVRPQVRGGLDWLRPAHAHTFRLSLWQRLINWINLKSLQRMVIREQDSNALRAWVQIESNFGTTARNVLLMTRPDQRHEYADMLMRQVVRRFGADGLVLHHPADDDVVSRVLRSYQFHPQRTVIHMRYDL